MRIGVLGGTFDPPHAAHAALARAARAQLGLDRVIWVPAFSPPHKGLPATRFEDRLAMTRALAAIDPAPSHSDGAEVSDVEASLPSPSYTLHTLDALRRTHGDGHAWFLILGADNWEAFPSWHRPDAVLAAATPVVYPRRGHVVRDLPHDAVVLHFPEMPEQSTAYREWLARDRDAALSALPAPVAACIRERGLYLNPSPNPSAGASA